MGEFKKIVLLVLVYTAPVFFFQNCGVSNFTANGNGSPHEGLETGDTDIAIIIDDGPGRDDSSSTHRIDVSAPASSLPPQVYLQCYGDGKFSSITYQLKDKEGLSLVYISHKNGVNTISVAYIAEDLKTPIEESITAAITLHQLQRNSNESQVKVTYTKSGEATSSETLDCL
ncbi:MAG: hypothetical protein KDD33_02115 [Bdellovibrionales bacterium]|nr:hypothetical protein [Bdellovibrionales bacterium]